MEMMGLRKAWTLNSELSAMARLSKREEKKVRDTVVPGTVDVGSFNGKP